MRATALSLLVLSSLVFSLRSDDAADAKSIIKKAMTAAGIKDTEKPIVMTWKDKGKGVFGPINTTYAGQWTFQGPDKLRIELKGDIGPTGDYSMVVNGDKVWEKTFGNTMPQIGENKTLAKNEVYLMQILTLAPLLHDKAYKLSTGGEKDVDDKKAILVKVAQDKKPPVTLYFDKTSDLLVKADMLVKDPLQAFKEVVEEHYFEDYKDVGGHKCFTKIRVLRVGSTFNPMNEATISDQKTVDKVDPKLFEQP